MQNIFVWCFFFFFFNVPDQQQGSNWLNFFFFNIWLFVKQKQKLSAVSQSPKWCLKIASFVQKTVKNAKDF